MRMTGKKKREKWERRGGQEGRKRSKARRGKERDDRDDSGRMENRAVQTG
jgi:hypothetical protein